MSPMGTGNNFSVGQISFIREILKFYVQLIPCRHLGQIKILRGNYHFDVKF